MCYGRGEADLGAQRRDHEGPRIVTGTGHEKAVMKTEFYVAVGGNSAM